jgi:hypothetical protein
LLEFTLCRVAEIVPFFQGEKVMTIEMLMAECPFCRDGAGDVFLDAIAVQNLRHNREHEKNVNLDACVFLNFNSPQPESGPCPHLVHLLLDFACVETSDGPSWGSGAGWINPLAVALDPHCDARDVLYDLRGAALSGKDEEMDQFGFADGLNFEFCTREWRDSIGRYFVEFSAIFTEDINRLFHELARAQLNWQYGGTSTATRK